MLENRSQIGALAWVTALWGTVVLLNPPCAGKYNCTDHVCSLLWIRQLVRIVRQIMIVDGVETEHELHLQTLTSNSNRRVLLYYSQKWIKQPIKLRDKFGSQNRSFHWHRGTVSKMCKWPRTVRFPAFSWLHTLIKIYHFHSHIFWIAFLFWKRSIGINCHTK